MEPFRPPSRLSRLFLSANLFSRRPCLPVVLLPLLFSMGCTTTRFRHPGPCLASLEPGSYVLVPWLPEENTGFYLDGLRKIHKRKNIALAFLAEQEWNLRLSGVADPLDSSNFDAMKASGFTHLLLIKELSSRRESLYAYYTQVELARGNTLSGDKPSWQERGNQSEIRLQLIPLNDLKATHTMVSETVIGHLIVRDADKGEANVNPTGIASARYKAMIKGARLLLRECSAR